MNLGFLRLRAQSEPWDTGISFALISEASQGKIAIAKPVLMETQEEIEPMRIEPCFTLDRDAAQILLNDLWNLGLRPADGTGSAGQLKATEKHLDDMRKLVFEKKQ